MNSVQWREGGCCSKKMAEERSGRSKKLCEKKGTEGRFYFPRPQPFFVRIDSRTQLQFAPSSFSFSLQLFFFCAVIIKIRQDGLGARPDGKGRGEEGEEPSPKALYYIAHTRLAQKRELQALYREKQGGLLLLLLRQNPPPPPVSRFYSALVHKRRRFGVGMGEGPKGGREEEETNISASERVSADN